MRRLLFNLGLRNRVRGGRLPPADLVVGFDIDGFLLSKALALPYVVLLKGVAAEEAGFESGLDAFRLRVLSLLERRNAAGASLVIVPSEYSARVVAREYGVAARRIAVVPEGIDLGRWLVNDRGSGRAPAPERSHATILTVARQYPRKNTGTLLAALPAVARAIPGARLRVVGGGPRLPALRRRARGLGIGERVDFLGALAGDDALRSEYAAADCFCLPSLQEGFGIVFLEAMAAGLPVVAGRRAAVPEVVADGETGILVNPESEEEVAAALVRLLTDHELRGRMAAAGAARVREYDLRKVVGRFLDAVEPLIGPRGLRRPKRAG